ncbi:RCC1 and BTB domain-containing protein 1-like [Cloeon dipterum]|uniref:RCC1 and BTB domain-containing protein 1-like n=1 Tax=Cloeon dipterum TaxID=197152 RepID=UPI00322093AD
MATSSGKRTNPGSKERKIRTAFVFGPNGENTIVVFENDEVFGLGKNQNGCLGTGGTDELTAFARIEKLCGKKIERFEYGSFDNKFSIFAISAIGNLFSWGENSYGQLGLGTESYTRVPTKIRVSLDWNVVRVACGRYHTLALTVERQVFAFGQNLYGQLGLGLSGGLVTNPQKICGLLRGRVVTSIACQALSSFALLASGEILAWGSNLNGRLGLPLSQTETPNTPCEVEGLNKISISRVVCGDHFTLALSKEGAIYAWGGNMYGQLGNGLEFVRTPTIISSEMGARVKDIDVSRFEDHTCAAITENDQVYMWGSQSGITIKKPIRTTCSSLDKVFSDASSSAVSCQLKGMMKEQDAREDSIIKCIQKGFDNPETADVTFIVEERKIHVHKFVLMMKSVVFKKLFLGNWKDSCAKELNIERYSYDSFYAFLKFFYTDEMDCTPELAPEVFAAAHFYRVSGLMEECEEIMKSNLSVKNAAAIYEEATLCGAKDLEKFCFNYCKRNLVEAVHSFESDECKREAIMDVYRRAANQDTNWKNSLAELFIHAVGTTFNLISLCKFSCK